MRGDRDGSRSEEVFDRAGVLRAARRKLDLSQRELAERIGVGSSTVNRAESVSGGGVSLEVVLAVLAAARLRIVVVDVVTGNEVLPENPDVVRDRAGRRFPAHLDPRAASYSDAPLCEWRRDRPEPEVTFDHRWRRYVRREACGVPDHHPTRAEVAVARQLLARPKPCRSRTGQCFPPDILSHDFVPDDWVPADWGLDE